MKKTTVRIEFATEEAADHFLSWFCGSGEQAYWDWMQYREEEEDGNITAVRFETHEFHADRQSQGSAPHSVKVREFAPRDIASEKGVVLDGAPGHDAVILKGNIVEGRSSDPLVVKFLYNGLTDQFRECRIALKRGGDVGWHLVNAENRRVPLVVVETWSLPLLGTVGIKTLQGLCA